ncbi:MAG: histidine kinase [Bryobacteraceae bacterium]
MQGLESSKGRRLLYWCLQLLGWGAYFGYSEIAVVLYSHNRRLALIWPVILLVHVYASHRLRALIRKRDWVGLPFRKLLPRLLGALLLLSMGVQLALVPVVVAAHAASLRQQLENCWYYAIFSFLLFALWTIFYFGFQYFFLYRDSELNRLRLEANLREMELRALKAQINPHFLFNCLNNLRSLVAEDSERAREMLLRLSELLRYSLDAGRHERVPLSDELEVVRAYLDLEKLQLDERLRWHLDISPEALGATVPPMLLQQLVENAVKHGIAEQSGGGEITITGRASAGRLELRVENTGQLSAKPGAGVGLTNARERLRLLCGAGAALSLDNVDELRVAATAEIPFAPA